MNFGQLLKLTVVGIKQRLETNVLSLYKKLQSIEDLIVSGSFDWIDVYVWGKLVNAALYKIHNFFYVHE